jgi:dipeptidyl aminopeptidase/acylaminoacyl peptidase
MGPQRQGVAGPSGQQQAVLPQVTQAPAPAVAQATAVPAATVVPTAVPTAAPTAAPTATPHPLSIATLRQGDYPGSEIVVDQVLPAGSTYSRQMVSYRSEGLKIQALMTVPRGPRPPSGWPVIVFNHGFIPPQQYKATSYYIAYVDAFARNGYLVFMPDYRGHAASEGRAGGAYSSPDYVVDVMNALASVRRHPEADPDRVGMWGHSMGGYITLRALVASDAIKAGVIWAGVVGSYPDMMYNWGNRAPGAPTPAPPPGSTPGAQQSWRNRMLQDFGTPEENPGPWASVSANTYLKDLTAPVQLHHGTADSSVPLRMTQVLDQQIREAGGSVETFIYPGDDHNLARNLGAALGRSVAFFDAHVKNG